LIFVIYDDSNAFMTESARITNLESQKN